MSENLNSNKDVSPGKTQPLDNDLFFNS